MLVFNSFLYILLFFPVILIVYSLLARTGFHRTSYAWLVAASLFFLAYSDRLSLTVFLASLAVNYLIVLSMLNRESWKKILLTSGLCFNVAMLGFFKYSNFFITNMNLVSSSRLPLLNIVLPLAISFYTFQHIAYLVDAYRGKVRDRDFLSYCLFFTFFPRLLMGPICRYEEIMPQFDKTAGFKPDYRNMSLGLYLFFIGLCKCTAVAAMFGIYADYGFSSQEPLTFLEAWTTSLSYTFQIYFDFSGYTDMAIGSALFFNIRLPVNFNSPYLSVNIQDFWRRWHITLSRFLRDYIYIPLGGGRKAEWLVGINVMITFLIGGLWHGAGWTFIVWGAMHGLALVIYRLWRKLRIDLPVMLSIFITFNFVNIAWVFFRARDIEEAWRILAAMAGANEFWGILAFGSVEFLDKIAGVIIVIISVLVTFLAKNTNEVPNVFTASRRQLAAMVGFILLGLFFLNSTLTKGFLYLDF